MKKYLLRCRLSYGESKRAGNGWRVCRTCNFSSREKLPVCWPLWGAIEKKETAFFRFFLGGCRGVVSMTLVLRGVGVL